MPNGRVKWFNNTKGYGFILADDPDSPESDNHAAGGASAGAATGDDLFVHFSSIQMEGYRTLRAGEAVAFDVVRADRGFHAINVRRLQPESEISAPAAAAQSAANGHHDPLTPRIGSN